MKSIGRYYGREAGGDSRGPRNHLRGWVRKGLGEPSHTSEREVWGDF